MVGGGVMGIELAWARRSAIGPRGVCSPCEAPERSAVDLRSRRRLFALDGWRRR